MHIIDVKAPPTSSGVTTCITVLGGINPMSHRKITDDRCGPLSSSSSVKFIRSQKKNAQLVYKGFLYNRKLTQQNGSTTWRCIDLPKTHCKAICVTKFNKLIRAKRQHNHENHENKIRYRPLYDYPEDLEEYLDIYSREPISATQKLDVIDDGTDYKLIVRDALGGHGAPVQANHLIGSGTETFFTSS
ncbi:uncharacterized protein LOC134221478 [Armigeres subalbatus]|uniref:uncharacterized protein LOC134221478 n=1 Tax=Armigeres subalbatus TaxID=124917 RepID=UPI002ED4BE9B